MTSSLRAGSLFHSTGTRVTLLPVASTHSTPALLFTVKSNLGDCLKGLGCLPPFALLQSPDRLCKSHLCQRQNPCSPDPHHPTGRDISGRLQQAKQVSFSILQGPWAPTRFSLHPPGYLDRWSPLGPALSHAHDTPLPSPQQSRY